MSKRGIIPVRRAKRLHGTPRRQGAKAARGLAETKGPRLNAGMGVPTEACRVSYRLKPLEAVGMAKPLRHAPILAHSSAK